MLSYRVPRERRVGIYLINVQRECAMSKPIIAIGLIAIAFTQTAIAADTATPGKAAKGAAPSSEDKKLIQSAMQAAPKKVSAAATIVVMGADGAMRTLREGTNGFTCMPD